MEHQLSFLFDHRELELPHWAKKFNEAFFGSGSAGLSRRNCPTYRRQ
jgi:hypothetical protein